MAQLKPLQSPGTVLKLFLRAYNLNPTSLARDIQLSQASVRLMTLDKLRISVQAALRLARYFSIKPEYWLELQNTYDLAMAAKSAKLSAVLKKIPVAKKPSAREQTPPAKKGRSKAAVKGKRSGTAKK
jgi:addiction module HigA family antidote